LYGWYPTEGVVVVTKKASTEHKGMERKGIRGGDPILTVRNRHVNKAPNFDQMIEETDYVSYFESELGDQWIFIRKRGADHAMVYGGDIAWEGVKVSEQTAEQIRETLEAEVPEVDRAKARRLVSQMMNMADPLVPGLVLNEPERTWLYDAWSTSTIACDVERERENDLDTISQRIAKRYALPALKKHPNTMDYRGAMAVIAVAVGREAGRRGMHEDAVSTLLEKTLEALPK
jgi:hypothetical protein